MGERKVLNKYYPPDFDPAKIPRRKQEKNRRMKVRMMLPMSIRCNTCGTYIYKGTKFNSNKEDVIGETYLGIQIFRFYFKCTRCSAELTMKTDPQNSDYIVESGAARNFEPWRNEEELTENEKRKREAEEMGDAMKSLENKASDSKKDMDILAALEEMRSMKSRHENVSLDVMLDALKRSETEQGKPIVDVDEEDEAIIKSIVFHNSENLVRRLPDDDDEDIDGNLVQLLSNSNNPEVLAQKRKGKVGNPTDYLSTTTIFNHSRTGDGGSLSLKPKFIVKPRAVADAKKPRSEPAEDEETSVESTNEKAKVAVASGLQSLCQNYDSDESE